MPAKSEKQRKFMGAELARKRAGKATQTDMTEEQLSDFASKQLQKITMGAKQEGVRPRLPDHLLPRKKGHGSEYPPDRGGSLGPYRELRKELQYLRYEVNYKLATPEQMKRGERCDTCIHWKDGAACEIVLGYIYPEAVCDHWEENEMLQGEHPIAHLQQSPATQKLRGVLNKDDGGNGGFAGGGTVFTSTNAGIFTPTHGGTEKVKKKKKTGIERLGQFITDNSPEKKMIKSAVLSLTGLIEEVRLELRKEDEKRQTPPRSKSTQDDPPQVVERDTDLPNDPNLVVGQKMTEKEQKRIMNEAKNKDGSDPHTLLMAWGSGGVDVDELHQGGKKDELESDETRNEPEKKKLPFTVVDLMTSKRFEKEREGNT